jgi:hypothetical protein
MILADLAIHVNAAAALWTAISGAGVGFSAMVMPQYIDKLPVAKAIANPDDRKVALDLVHDYILSESIRAAQHLPAFAVGLLSFVVPPAPRAAHLPATTATFAAAALAVLVWMNALVLANSIRAYLAWRRRYGVVAAGQRQGVRRRRR